MIVEAKGLIVMPGKVTLHIHDQWFENKVVKELDYRKYGKPAAMMKKELDRISADAHC